jgi:hypothetical protein
MIKVVYSYTRGEIASALQEMYLPMAEAASAAIASAAETIKAEARADIGRAGFSKRWQNTLRVDVHPKGRVRKSVNAAAHIYHKIGYAGVFEDGATISGKPNMWIPMRWIPTRLGRQRLTPKTFEAATGKRLFPIVRGGKTYLATSMRVAGAGKSKYSAASIRRGSTGSGKGEMRSVPMFLRIRRVDIPKKFNITAIVERARDRLAQLYIDNMKG